jgi:hypothetical protein
MFLSHSVSLIMNCYVMFGNDVAASYKFYTNIYNMESFLLHIKPLRATWSLFDSQNFT